MVLFFTSPLVNPAVNSEIKTPQYGEVLKHAYVSKDCPLIFISCLFILGLTTRHAICAMELGAYWAAMLAQELFVWIGV